MYRIAAALLIFMSGCGSGGGDAATPVVAQDTPAPVQFAQPFSDTTGRVVVPCTQPKGTAVIVVVGQSLSVNNVDSIYAPTQALNHQLHIQDGLCYQTKDPMLGINGELGTWMGRLADKLITDGRYTKVVIVPIGVGATTVAQWAGVLKVRIDFTGAQLAAAGLTCTAVLWGQGESDTAAGTTRADYASDLATVISHFNAAMPGCPFFVAREAYYYGVTSPAILAAQDAAPNGVTVFSGENVEAIAASGRFDNTHLNATGADQRAAMVEARMVSVLGL